MRNVFDALSPRPAAEPVSDAATLELVGLAYDCALSADAWTTFFTALTRRLGATSAGITFRDTLGVDQRWVGLDPAFEAAYLREHHRTDPWILAVRRRPPALGEVVVGHRLATPAELEASPCYQQLCIPHRMLDLVGVMLAQSPEGLVHVSVFFPELGGPRVLTAVPLLVALVPHLQRVVALARSAAISGVQISGLQDVLERGQVASLVVSSSLRVLRANPRAQRLLDAGDLMGMGRDGRLVFQDARVNAEVLGAAMRGEAFRIPVHKGTGGAPQVVLGSAVQGSGLGENTRCLSLYVVDSVGARVSSAESLRLMFGLTPAETRLAQHLYEGLTPRECATRMEVSWNTVRTHLKHLLSKTGTNRQSQLLRLVSTLSLVDAPPGTAPSPRQPPRRRVRSSAR